MTEFDKLKKFIFTLSITHIGVFLAFYSFIYQYVYYQEFSVNITEFSNFQETIVLVFITIPKIALIFSSFFYLYRQVVVIVLFGKLLRHGSKNLTKLQRDNIKNRIKKMYERHNIEFAFKYPPEQMLGAFFVLYMIMFFSISGERYGTYITIALALGVLFLLRRTFNHIFYLRGIRPHQYLNYLRCGYLFISLFILITVFARVEANIKYKFGTYTEVGFIYNDKYYRTSETGRYKYVTKTDDELLIYNRYGHFTLILPNDEIKNLVFFNKSDVLNIKKHP